MTWEGSILEAFWDNVGGVTFQLTHVKCELSTMERQAAALVNGKVFLLVESERKKKNDEIGVENLNISECMQQGPPHDLR